MRSSLGIWRALDHARRMNLESAGELHCGTAPDGITRRRLIAAIAGGGAALVLPRAVARAAERRRVIIVGGGLAGLSALRHLRASGADAILYEARPMVGGRTRSARGVFAPDYAFDLGGQLVNSDHADLRALIRALGLRLIDRSASGEGREIQIARSGKPVRESSLAQALRRIARVIGRDSERLDADYANVAPAIDGLSVKNYLDAHNMPPGDARQALEAGIRTEYGLEPDQASAIELVFNLPTIDGARVTRLSLSDERYLVEGGAGRVAEELAKRMAGAIRLNKRLASINIEAPRARLTFADGEMAEADRVILALPAPLLRDIRIEGLLPTLWRQLIDEVRLGSNEKLIVGYDRRAWRKSLGADGALWASEGFSEAWDSASVIQRPSAPGALTYFLGGAQVAAASASDSRALRQRFSSIASRAIPGLPAPNGRVRRTRWTDDPLARGAYIGFRPGQLTRFGSLLTLEGEGGTRASGFGPLLFAGEWLSDAWPGYMNGAVQTGRIAAEAALHAEALAA